MFDDINFLPSHGAQNLNLDDESCPQLLFKAGLKTDLNLNPHDESRKYERVLACGQALAGFDFAVERCGFGVSVLSAHLVVNILKNHFNKFSQE
ncbi:MAG: hypothetical protein ACD_9C00109G0001 [uncultured bacterium]|nr:MAG: hypothetical protein ACD_9C00109G0001 [uncultured bacterium]